MARPRTVSASGAERSARLGDLLHEVGNLNHRSGQDLGYRCLQADVRGGILAEATDTAERLHRLRERALALGIRLEAILVQEAEIPLRYTEWRSQVVNEQIERLRGVGLRPYERWHTSCLLTMIADVRSWSDNSRDVTASPPDR